MTYRNDFKLVIKNFRLIAGKLNLPVQKRFLKNKGAFFLHHFFLIWNGVHRAAVIITFLKYASCLKLRQRSDIFCNKSGTNIA